LLQLEPKTGHIFNCVTSGTNVPPVLAFVPLALAICPRKIIKIGVTRCQIFMLKCTKCDFGWGSAPDPAEGAYSAPPDALAGLGDTVL